jgi:hypothetical protein
VGATVFELTALQPFKLPQAVTSYDIIVQAQNAAGAGPASSLLTAMTSGATGQTAPSQVVGLAASPASSSSVQLSWSNPGRLGARDELYFYYGVTGSSNWTSSVTAGSGNGTVITGLQAATSYDFEVIGLNASGTGPASLVTAGTLAVSQSMTSIAWNLLLNGTYTDASGTIGLFTLHGVDEQERPVLRRELKRANVESFFAKQDATEVVLEACGGSHHWGRLLSELGHRVRLIPPQYVKPFVKRAKNDRNDAEAISEAASRPTMRRWWSRPSINKLTASSSSIARCW